MNETKTLGRAQWFVLAAAFLGWMFDGLEMGLFPIAARPALQDLLPHVTETEIGTWISYLVASFLLGAACGGLVFGWMGDRLGRVRTMAVTILAYSIFTGCCYFVPLPIGGAVFAVLTTLGVAEGSAARLAELLGGGPTQLAAFRFCAALGMGGEWALGVALVVECWPERFRPLLAGVIGAASNVGFLLIALLGVFFRVAPDQWRWIMLAGASPALLAFLILMLIPESQRWKESVRTTGARPIREIFTTRLIWPTLLAIVFASVALIGTWGAVSQFLPTWTDKLAGPENPHAKGVVQVVISIGAIIGCLVAPLVGGRIGRRPAYFGLCLLSLVSCAYLFRMFDHYSVPFVIMAGVVGAVTAAFYGWLPLYLPELFPTRVRTTGQGLSFNFGRIFAAAGALATGRLMEFFGGSYPKACATITLVYLVGMVMIWFAPETKGRPLPD